MLKLRWFVLLIAGDLNADPAIIPCLAKGISAGRFLHLALAYSRGACVAPDATCRFSREGGAGSRRGLIVGCTNALAASDACFVTDRWFTPVWPACWLDTPDRSSSSAARVVQDVWDVYRDELGLVPAEVVLALGDAVSRSSVEDFGSIWSRHAEAGLFRAYSRAGGPAEAGSAAFHGRGLLRIRSRRLGGRVVGGRGSGRLYRASQGDEVDVHCQVVDSRRNIGIRKWAGWLREDLGSRPYAWLRPDFVPPSPLLFSRTLRLSHLGFWLNLIS